MSAPCASSRRHTVAWPRSAAYDSALRPFYTRITTRIKRIGLGPIRLPNSFTYLVIQAAVLSIFFFNFPAFHVTTTRQNYTHGLYPYTRWAQLAPGENRGSLVKVVDQKSPLFFTFSNFSIYILKTFPIFFTKQSIHSLLSTSPLFCTFPKFYFFPVFH